MSGLGQVQYLYLYCDTDVQCVGLDCFSLSIHFSVLAKLSSTFQEKTLVLLH